MPARKFDLRNKFEEYFAERVSDGLRAEPFAKNLTAEEFDLWKAGMFAFFLNGARVMAQDSVDTLQDYAAAVAGIKDTQQTAETGYANAADNLMHYHTGVLDQAAPPVRYNPFSVMTDARVTEIADILISALPDAQRFQQPKGAFDEN